MQASLMLLGVGKYDHDDHSHYDKSFYERLNHGWHPNRLAPLDSGHYDEHHGRGPSMRMRKRRASMTQKWPLVR